MEKYSKDAVAYYKNLQIIFLTIVLLLSFSLLVQAQITEGSGNWFVINKEDPMTDKKEIGLILADQDTLENQDASNIKSINIRKSPNKKPELFIRWSSYLADNNLIKWRFDKGEINQDYWIMSADDEAVFFPDEKELMKFIEKLILADKIAIELTPYNKKPNAAVFNLDGLGENLKPYLEELGWEELKPIINK